MALIICNEARSSRCLQPRRDTPILTGSNADARCHFGCARTALIAGPPLTALRHTSATTAADLGRLYGYTTLFACALPKPLLRFPLDRRARHR